MAPDNIVVVDAGHRDLLTMHMVVPLATLCANQPRHLDTGSVDRLAQSMKEVGLIQPVVVRRNGTAYMIVAGHHRVAAARALGWVEIDAFVLSTHVGHLAAELVAIDENLCRAELTAAERAIAIKHRKQIWEAMHPREIQVEQLVPPDIGYRKPPAQDKGFAADTARATGQSKQDINRHVARAEALGDDITVVAGTCLDKGTELDALKRLPADQRKDLIRRAASGEKVSARTTAAKVKPEAPPPLPRVSSKLVPVPRADMNHALNALNKSLTATRAFLEATRGYPMARRSEIAALTKKLNAAVAALDHLVETTE